MLHVLSLLAAVGGAGPTASAVEAAAAALADSLPVSKGEAIFVAPIDGPRDPIVAELQQALAQALRRKGARLIDDQAMRAALSESRALADLGAQEMNEAAGGLGAKLVLNTTVQLTDAGWLAHTSLVGIEDGRLRGSGRAEIASTPDAGEAGAAPLSLLGGLRTLADRLAQSVGKLGAQARYQTYAVLPFEESGPSSKDKQLGLLVSAELSTLLQRDHRFILVERSQLSRVLDELALGQSGLVDEKSAAQVGRLTGAHGLIVGSVAEAGAQYLVNAKVVSTQDAQIKVAEQVALPAADLVALSADAVVLRTRAGAVYRSLLLPGWGQHYNRQATKGFVFVGAEALTAGLAVTYHFLGQKKREEYESISEPADEQRFAALHDKAEQNFRMRNWFIVAALSIHALNIVDALLSGETFESATPGVATGGAGTSSLLSW